MQGEKNKGLRNTAAVAGSVLRFSFIWNGIGLRAQAHERWEHTDKFRKLVWNFVDFVKSLVCLKTTTTHTHTVSCFGDLLFR